MKLISPSSFPAPGRGLYLVRLGGVAVIFFGASLMTGVAVQARQQPAAAAQQTAPTPTAPTKDHPEFPEGAGRDTTLRVCSKCHSPNNILAQGRDRQGWADLISKMVDLGAQGTDEEFTAVLDYVTVSFPPAGAKVNINKAAAAQIVAVVGLTPDDAKRLVEYRAKNGEFKTLEDVKKVPEVDAKRLDAKKDLIAF